MDRLLWTTFLVIGVTTLAGCMEASGSSQSGSNNCLLFCDRGSGQEASFNIDLEAVIAMLLVFVGIIAAIIVIAVAAVAAGRRRNGQQQQQQVVVQVGHHDDPARR